MSSLLLFAAASVLKGKHVSSFIDRRMFTRPDSVVNSDVFNYTIGYCRVIHQQ